MNKALTAATMLALSSALGSAQAATLSINDISPSFYGADGGTNVQYDSDGGHAAVTWGLGRDREDLSPSDSSGYEADVGQAPEEVSDGVWFEFASFTHNNNLIYYNSAIDSVNFDVTLDLSVDFEDGNGVQDIGLQTFSFDVLHNETPNNPDDGVCDSARPDRDSDPINSAGCADVVDIIGDVSGATLIVSGYELTLSIIGFLDEATGEFNSSFFSAERASNTRILIAEFTVSSLTTVPVPAGGLLLLGGLAGLGALRRRRRA